MRTLAYQNLPEQPRRKLHMPESKMASSLLGSLLPPPLLWHAKIDANRLIADLAQRIQDPHRRPNDHAPAPASWAYCDLMQIPRTYFIDGDPVPIELRRRNKLPLS